jgi:hypothetical protein
MNRHGNPVLSALGLVYTWLNREEKASRICDISPENNRRDFLCNLQPHAGLVVVAGLAQRLPVAFVPEQALVTAMRDDVIHHRRGLQHAVAPAFRA